MRLGALMVTAVVARRPADATVANTPIVVRTRHNSERTFFIRNLLDVDAVPVWVGNRLERRLHRARLPDRLAVPRPRRRAVVSMTRDREHRDQTHHLHQQLLLSVIVFQPSVEATISICLS